MNKSRILRLSLLILVAVPFVNGMRGGQIPLQPAAQIGFRPVDEMSGIVKSRRLTDTYWLHNDSGDKARIFAVQANGNVIVPNSMRGRDLEDYEGVRVTSARNVDWEDIAIDGNTLYLADVGNNGNARQDLAVYAVREPDPRKVDQVNPFAKYVVRYQDQRDFPPSGPRAFDCEAVFVFRGKLHFITKNRMNALFPDVSASLYRMDTKFTDRPNVLTKLDTRASLGGWVTGADVSPDGKTLAVLTQSPEQSVWLFDTSARDGRMLSQGRPRRIVFSGAKQCEAICFVDNNSLLVTNEQRDIFRIQVDGAVPVR